MLVLEGDLRAVVDDGDRVRERAQHPHRHRAVVPVRAQHRVRVAVLAGDDLVEDASVEGKGGAHRSLASCWSVSASSVAARLAIAWSGIASQVGRLRAS